MRKFIIALAAAAIVFSSSVSAEFSDIEKQEAAKLIEARLAVSDALKHVADAIKSGLGEPYRPQIYDVLEQLEEGSKRLRLSFAALTSTQRLLLAPVEERPPRAEEVADAQSEAASALSELTTGYNAAGGIPLADMPGAQNDIQAAINWIADINWGLSYADPLPDDHPRIVGPHGHQDMAATTLRRADLYLHQSWIDVNKFYLNVDVWPTTADAPMFGVLRTMAFATERLMRAWGLDLHIALPDDQALVDEMEAAGSGLRGNDFFKLLLAVELTLNPDKPRTPPIFNGRDMVPGVSAVLMAMENDFTAAVAAATMVNDVTEVRTWWVKQGTPAANPQSTHAHEFYRDFGDMWKDLDDYANAAIAFFFEIPAPPGGGGPPPDLVCGMGTTLDDTTTPPSCVSTVICPPFPPDEVLRVDSVVADDVNGTITFSCRP